MRQIRQIDFSPEWKFRTSRSSGKGGQNVNKVESRVELVFHPGESALLTDEEKERLQEKLQSRLDSEGFLHITAETDRSQLRNREIAIEKFYNTLELALSRPKPRKATRPSRAAMERRLEAKRQHADRKARRRKGDY